MYAFQFSPFEISDDEFGKRYTGTSLRKKRDRQFRHLEKFEKGYRRKH